DRSDGLDALSGGVVELPVFVAFAGEDRAGVAAAHRDDDIGCSHGVGGEELGALGGDIDADLAHGVDDGGVELVGGFGPGGANLDLVPSQVSEEAGGHLGTAGV